MLCESSRLGPNMQDSKAELNSKTSFNVGKYEIQVQKKSSPFRRLATRLAVHTKQLRRLAAGPGVRLSSSGGGPQG